MTVKYLFRTFWATLLFAWLMPQPIQAQDNDGETFYAQSTEGVQIEFSVISTGKKTCLLKSVSESAIGHVTIPEVAQGFTVTDIGYRAFDKCNGLTGVTIPNTVTTIDGGAFYSCENLKSLLIPNSVNNMGKIEKEPDDDDDEPTPQPPTDNIKRSKNNKEKITIIGPIAIGCTSLNSINVEKGNTTYDSRNDCNAIIETATNTLLTGCVNTIIPNSVTSIGYGVFAELENLKTIDIPTSVINIGDYAFVYTGLTQINLPSSVINIGKGAFEGTRISEIYIPYSVINIGDYAFDCKELSRVFISNSVKSLGDGAFGEKTQLDYIYSDIEEPFSISDYVFSNATYSYCILYVPNGTATKYQAQTGWSKFNNIIEQDNIYVQSTEGVLMEFSVISAGKKTCSLKSVNNSAIGHVTIPEVVKGFTVTEITESAFYKCDGLTGVTIPYTVTKIDGRPFYDCPSLSSIKIDSKNPIFDSRDDCNAIIETATDKLLFGCKATKIPTTVTSLGIAAFENISGLVEITIPNSVTNIGAGAFYECNDLTKLTIPSSVTSIGTADNEISDDYMSIVYGCSSLISLSVEEGNRYYDSRNNCNAIIETASNTLLSGCVNTVIPNTISSIGSGAFAGIKNLRTIDIPYSVVNIGDFAFEHAGLTKITIPNSVVNIGKDAFQGIQLTELIIPNSVINIGRGAFSDCELLTTIFIPKSLAKIGDEAFYCYEGAISNIYSEIEEPFAINEYTFNKETYANCKLHVPYGTTSKYQAQAGWSKFENIIEPQDGDVFKEITAEGIEMTFTIVSAKDKTCIVGTSSSDAAISNTTTGIVTIPETAKGYKVIGVGEYAFLACTGVTGISIPASVIGLLEYSFSGCSGLNEISLPSGLQWIGEKAFSGCSALTSITIPASVTGFGHEVFIGCTNLSDVYSEIIKPFDLYDDVFRDAIYYKDATLHVPEGTKALYKEASGWKNFKNIDSGILEDGDYYTIQTIEGCDLYCQVIDWKEKTCRIGFEKVHWGAIPVNSITGEKYEGGITIPSIANGYTVIQIEQGAFTGEEGLEYVVIPNTVKTINDYAFPYCENLKEIVLPNGLISIGKRAFEACKSLQTVVIPNSVNSIGKYAFANCMSLYSVTSLVNIPFKLDETVFVVENEDYDRDVMYGIAKLYVPMGRLSIYQQTTGWEKFQNIIERTMSNKLTYMLDGNVYKTYDVQPGEVVTPEPDPIREGYDFSGWEGVPVIMPDHDVVVTGYFTPGTGVADLREAEVQLLQIYTLSGQRLSAPHKGINIINGKKVLVK